MTLAVNGLRTSGARIQMALWVAMVTASVLTAASLESSSGENLKLKIRQQKEPSNTRLDLLSKKSATEEAGISRLVSGQGWQLTESFSGLRAPRSKSEDFLRAFRGDFSLQLSCSLNDSSQGSLLALRHPQSRLPFVDVQAEVERRVMRLRYLGVESYQRVEMPDALPRAPWKRLAVQLRGKTLTVVVDCKVQAEVKLRQALSAIPSGTHIVFGERLGPSGLVGIVSEATLAVKAEGQQSCSQAVSDVNIMVGDQPAEAIPRLSLEESVKERFNFLAQELSQLNKMVDMIKVENLELKSRLEFLETCECRPSCSFQGTTFAEGMVWSPDLCTVCRCVRGLPSCKRRMDIPSCTLPCDSSPCQQPGTCGDVSIGARHVARAGGQLQCLCPPPFTGPACQVRRNPCVWPVAPGICDLNLGRFYYDRGGMQDGVVTATHGLSLYFCGCGGNVNNYETIDKCVGVAMVGACCYRTFSITLSSVVHKQQNLEIHCKTLHVGECEMLHRPQGGLDAIERGMEATNDTEVVSFYPGLSCEEAGCQASRANCTVGGTSYSLGQSFRLGCQNCTCTAGGVVNCTCRTVTVRRELRDLTQEEVVRFQQAVARLQRQQLEPKEEEEASPSVWEQFRDLYMTHRMHASGAPYFLPWHRYFLRQVEQRLQEVDCGVVLPYLDFTTDVGDFARAIVWQANYFGGGGNASDGGCVPDHPFGDPKSWQPCISRQFNTSVSLPTQLEVALCLASEDFTALSLCLESVASYLHAFVGGDLLTSGSPYDPVFYALHTYVDLLYWDWQRLRGAHSHQFPAAYGHVPLVPFNLEAWRLFDSEAALCVTYAYPSEGHLCNVTQQRPLPPLPAPPRPGPTGRPVPVDTGRQRGDIPVHASDLLTKKEAIEVVQLVELDPFGYDSDGFDRTGYDRFGYNRQGYNRDGFDKEGYDVTGYDRYGVDRDGYSFEGFNRTGLDREGNSDSSGRFGTDGFDAFCLNREGLNPDGYDQFGFNVNGRDASGCNFHHNGPFALRHSLRIFRVLRRQSKPFLMSLARTCQGLYQVPDIWFKQTWITERKDIAGLVRVDLPGSAVSVPSRRFCLDTDVFLLSHCLCDAQIATCQQNPCLEATCSAFPEARCHISFCGNCTARWILDGRQVDCSQERDYCQPSPCQNKGSCVPSVWPNEPQLVTCVCPPGYEGHLCQHKVLDVCALPLSTGKCEQQEERWFYNHKTGKCERFTYTGCHGNANNFLDQGTCEARCVIGSCCFREPMYTEQPIGYNIQGFNKYGFNLTGFNRLQQPVTVDVGTATGKRRLASSGWDWLGFDATGYNIEGFDHYGYDRSGYDKEGFNITGYNRIGEYDGIIEYDEFGFDSDGFSRAGFNCYGHDRRGLDVLRAARGFRYRCRPLTRLRCQGLEGKRSVEVVRFEPGTPCPESGCTEECGCLHGGRVYRVREEFRSGCQQCRCMEGGQTVCVCEFAAKRREIRELTREELELYQRAVRQLLTRQGEQPSRWFRLAELYARHKPQAVGTPAFLPWHRAFLAEVDKELQAIDCTIAIPYYDWALDAGDPARSPVWAANILGGNGRWDGCVRYHPFKGHHPPFLAPCLRRRFNVSVGLPDAINVQLALNEPDYDRFRLHLELFAKLLQIFVGGHMDSDLAPYDPVFYSVMAYVDKLWVDWQGKHEDGVLRYPPDKRFVPLPPFGSTPDDVMDARLQMCVEYLPLLDGAPCNTTEVRHFRYDAQGYDRHGYDRTGFDRDGYSIEGVDKVGHPDRRGLYNTFGFNRQGYSRSGYDETGYDKFGFYHDSYNIDGYDPQGYDRTGYDRYGFDRQGYDPAGIHRNDSRRTGSLPKQVQLYDPYGYNIYGLNRFGFDREGYDVFGFNQAGFNRRVCKHYHIGPAYILVKRIVEEKLKTLREDYILRVARLCPTVSRPPDYMLANSWLTRHGQDQQVQVLYDVHAQNHPFLGDVKVRNTSVLDNGLWLPVPPDARFCIQTYAYTPCDVARPAVECSEDLCVGLTCPGHPSAVCRTSNCGHCHSEWYDGVTGNFLNCTGCLERSGVQRREGESWQPDSDACETCTCQEGLVVCRKIECGAAACDFPLRLPDQCCPSCQGCDYEGQVVPSGQPVSVPSDPCSTCLCAEGNVRCTVVTCPLLGDCRSPALPPGQCCHVCLDCGRYADGDTWRPSPCQQCSCREGQVQCDTVVCPPVNCAHPYTPQGHCCPLCKECFYNGAVYEEGEELRRDACSNCTCVTGSMQCRQTDCPRVACANPVLLPDQCCPICALDCDYEGQTYPHGTDFYPGYNPCLSCMCDNSIVHCRVMQCPPADLPSCPNPVPAIGQCCPTICPKCSHGGREYDEGKTWTPVTDPCQTCECRGGIATCRQTVDCAAHCTHGVPNRDGCCSNCTDCLFEGRVIGEGRQIRLLGTSCRECTCQRGSLQCQTQPVCPTLPCTVLEHPPGSCCPVCLGCEVMSRQYRHGEIVSQTECSQCVCQEGQVVCVSQRDRCPPARCSSPKTMPGQCCPLCEGCEFYSHYYEDGQTFVSLRDPCQKCSCQKGRVTCVSTEMDCPKIPCSHPARFRDQCCPQCHDCNYKHHLVRNGQRFSPTDGDSCLICKCQNGSVACDKTECPPVRCESPSTRPGQCCPECPAVCVLDDQQYRDGDRFSRPGDDCSTCVCQGGQARCEADPCGPATCNHPATLPGECCPRCHFCLYERRIFRHGQRFLHPDHICQQCACQEGTVTCETTTCPELACPRPMPMPGSCCPVCPKDCEQDGLNYNDGTTFTPPNSPCEECLCRQGRVQCKRLACPPAPCRYPRREGCCLVCSGCHLAGISAEDGETLQDPRDPCHSCSCQAGEVTCRGPSCPPAPCRNPATQGCCPVCDSCEFGGQTFLTGQVFTDPREECRQCQCLQGSVECTHKACSPTQCLHPVRRGCCKECSGCDYRGRVYADGQTFVDPESPCGECCCELGTVTCRRPQCPPVTCAHPTMGACCPECRDCSVQGRTVATGQVFPHDTDRCQVCQCQQGEIICSFKGCPPAAASCRNPVRRDCCTECTDCEYGGQEYKNGSQFAEPRDPCQTCSCLMGNVLCRTAACPPVLCSNPVQGRCCPECTQCLFENYRFLDGQNFPHPRDRCQNCLCRGGVVTCQAKDCAQLVSCSHPVSVPGHCCPACDHGCFTQGKVYKDGESYTTDCRECTCTRGSVQCRPMVCRPALCAHPVTEGCCPVCNDCLHQGHLYMDGQLLPDRSDACGECSCQAGTFSCHKRPCPPVSCLHPAMDTDMCCRECNNCLQDGRIYQNGQRFADHLNRCQQCICKAGTVSCERPQCVVASCQNPVVDECGCGSCAGCMFLGKVYNSEQSFHHPGDQCQQCICQGGNVTCTTKECERSCSHPVQTGICCPQCSDCFYGGVVRRQGVTFRSELDACLECICKAGSITCVKQTCPALNCLNPIHLEHHCCPACPVCLFFGQTIEDNTRFTHPNDSCQTCTCMDGRVNCQKELCLAECTHPRQDLCCPRCDMCLYNGKLYDNGQAFRPDNCKRCLCLDGSAVCEEERCPELNCLMTEQLPGECCPQCKGCDYHDHHYTSNSTFLSPISPCMTCVCTGGLVTCMTVECYVPCQNPVPVPGQCCQVCPGCNHNGIMYNDGEDFSPNGDSCDVCHCGAGRLSCLHETCPNVANCPAESLVAPEPGQCCPTCAGLSSGCTVEDVGKITRPRPKDPCLYCQCKEDYSWVCAREACDPLLCPPDVQMFLLGHCCPTCPACYDKSEAMYHQEGDTWITKDNPCMSCSCQDREVNCTLQECDSLSCGPTERLTHQDGQCCDVCLPMAEVQCIYQNKKFEPAEEWVVDECTRCSCQGGEISCSVQTCSLEQCATDDIPVTAPGRCCPVCLKRPGNCMVFGDPHYQTFDGTMLHFQGTCRYIMAADCQSNEFSVEVQHDNRNAPGEVSWAQNFTVIMGSNIVELLQNSIVRVNGVQVELPFLQRPHIYVESSGRTVLLTTNLGLQVSWDGESQGEVMVPGSYKGRMCGLCGNFNGYPQDDLRTRAGQIVASPAVFGNSWKSATQMSGSCQDASDIDPCQEAGYRLRKIATTRCAILKGKEFVRCHRVVSPEPYFASCVYDMCVCMDDPKCLCNILGSYAHECARAGVKIDWRSHNLCAFDCPQDKGFMFDECGPVCPRTCENVNTPLGNLTTNCFKPCVPSCQCTADKVVHGGRCISPSECPKLNVINMQ